METSVKAAEVLVPPQPEVASPSLDNEAEAAAPPAASTFLDPMEEFNMRLEDIISTYGSAASVLDKQSVMEAEMEKLKTEAKGDFTVATETEVALIVKTLSQFSSPQDKLDNLLRRHAELAASQHCDEKQLGVLQQMFSALHAETRSSITARSKLENLCRELQEHYTVLQEQTIRRCREDEEKRSEMAGHFQVKLTEIQAQIEQHSARNDKLCRENANLTDKLEGLVNQCELREESLEKINKRRDLQQKLTEAKLQQADALLAEAEEKHKREKEYLLREAIDKTKKCFAMKEQELAMKKKLTLYAQKFDEFQETLAKSNQIYSRFKKEMDNMSEKMKKMEKESNLWKTRFENCNKALTDMIEERTEKSKEYDVFVLKIQKLEKLCRALQEERAVLYDKIKEVRHSGANIPKILSGSKPDDAPNADGADKSVPPNELQEIQEEDPVLTEDMTRLKEEQAKLQEFAASLLATPSDDDEEEKKDLEEDEEDVVASAFVQFKTKPEVRKPPQEDMVPAEPRPEETRSAGTEVVQVQTHMGDTEPVPAEPVPTPEEVQMDTPAGLKPEAAEAKTLAETSEVEPVIPVKEEVIPAEPAQVADEAPTASESTPPEVYSATGAAPPSSESSKKQTPKKKKKRSAKNAS